MLEDNLPSRSGARKASSFRGFFQCMRCGKPLTSRSATAMHCSACGAIVDLHQGIIDFVGGAARTNLDNMDYDQVYGINAEHSRVLLDLLIRSAGPLWPDDFGDALEIGCGTGGLSLALLSSVSFYHAVVTDVSLKMLRQCRTRLRQAGSVPGSKLTFATYSGTETCFQSSVFDTCFGTAVVHHIADVPRFLRHVHAVLSPGGVAFFMEPNLEFHRALTAVVADIAADLLREQLIPEAEINRMLVWLAEVHCNIVNTGDLEILAQREDKHLFDPDTFAAWADAAGFAESTALPCDLDPTGWETAQAYFAQIGLSAEALGAVERLWSVSQVRYFAGLAPRDQSPSFLFWLRRGMRRTRTKPPVRPTTAARVSPPPLHPTHIWLTLALRQAGTELEIIAEGWCLAEEPVRALRIRAGDATCKLPIWRARPDVQVAANRNGFYPALHAFCSGIDGTVSLGSASATVGPVAVDVAIVTVGGTLRPVGTALLTVDGAPAKIEHIVIQ